MEQISLRLIDDGQPETPVDWSYRYSEKSLVEEASGLRYVYGTWNHLFGCWVTADDGDTPREIIPNWRLMNERGVWRECDISFRIRFPKLNIRRSLKWRRQERAAFVAYLSSIPRSIRSLVSPFGRYGWLLMDMIWQVPEFAGFLDQEIRSNNGQFVVAVLALSEASEASRDARRSLVRKLMTTKRKVLIDSLASVSETSRFINILNNLGDVYYEPDFYFELADVMNCPKRSRLLSNERKLKWEVVFGLNDLPDELLASPIVRLIDDGGKSYSRLRNLVGLLEAVPTSIRNRMVDAFRNVVTPEGASHMVERWEKRLSDYISFPNPPLAYHDRLTPLSCPDAMRREANEMNNCLSDLIGGVVGGGVYYYHWEGPEPATVRIRNAKNNRGGHWIFSDAAGLRNAKLPSELFSYLQSLIERLSLEKPAVSWRDPPPIKPPITLAKTSRKKNRDDKDQTEDRDE